MEECAEKFVPGKDPTQDSSAQLWNFNKISQLGKIIERLAYAQGAFYEIKPIPELQTYLVNVKVVDRKTQQQQSRLYEPPPATWGVHWLFPFLVTEVRSVEIMC